MTAYIAQLEQGQAVTPDVTEQSGTREGQDDVLYHQSNRTVSNPQVLKAKEDRAKLQGFIVTAGNLDEQRAEGPRPITPLRPVNTAQLPLVGITSSVHHPGSAPLTGSHYTIISCKNSF